MICKYRGTTINIFPLVQFDSHNSNTHSTPFIACLLECNCCAFFALANRVITVRFVGFIAHRGTPNKGLFLAMPPAEQEQETKSITLLTPFFFVIHPLLTDINGLDTPQRGMDETAVGVDQNVTLLHHWRRSTRQIRSNQIGGH